MGDRGIFNTAPPVAGPMGVPKPAGDLDPVALENALMETWINEGTFEATIDARRDGASPFPFIAGTPPANARPGTHHVITHPTSAL